MMSMNMIFMDSASGSDEVTLEKLESKLDSQGYTTSGDFRTVRNVRFTLRMRIHRVAKNYTTISLHTLPITEEAWKGLDPCSVSAAMHTMVQVVFKATGKDNNYGMEFPPHK